jgi:hypothetical protein
MCGAMAGNLWSRSQEKEPVGAESFRPGLRE